MAGSDEGSLLLPMFTKKMHLARRLIMVLVSKQYLSSDEQDASQKYPTDHGQIQGFRL